MVKKDSPKEGSTESEKKGLLDRALGRVVDAFAEGFRQPEPSWWDKWGPPVIASAVVLAVGAATVYFANRNDSPGVVNGEQTAPLPIQVRNDAIELVWEAIAHYRAGGPRVDLQTPPPLYRGDRVPITLVFAGGEMACDSARPSDEYMWGIVEGPGSLSGAGCSVTYVAPANVEDETSVIVAGGYQDEYARSDLMLTLLPVADRARIFLLDVSARMNETIDTAPPLTAGDGRTTSTDDLVPNAEAKASTVFEVARSAIEFQHSDRTPRDRATALWVFGGTHATDCNDRVDNPLEYQDWATNQQEIGEELGKMEVSVSFDAPLSTALLEILGSLPAAVKGENGEASIVVVAGGGNGCQGADLFAAYPLLNDLEDDDVVVNLFLVPANVRPQDEGYLRFVEEVTILANEFPQVLRFFECTAIESIEDIDLDAFCA